MSPALDPFAPALAHLNEVLRGLRAGRAASGLVENVEAQAYGTSMRLRDLATITTPDQKTIQVEPWDKSLLPAVEKALTAAPLGVNPVVSGQTVRVSIPPLSEERRRELVRLIRQHVEEARVSIRNTREKLLKDLKRRKDGGELSEDTFERDRKALQKNVEEAQAAAEARGTEKEQDILTV